MGIGSYLPLQLQHGETDDDDRRCQPCPGHRPALGWRLFYAVPVVGWIARDISRDAENILYAVIILITALVLGAMTWGRRCSRWPRCVPCR